MYNNRRNLKMIKKPMASAISLGIVYLLLSAGTAAPEDIKARVKGASGIFLGAPDPSVTSVQVLKSILELLDITAALTPDSEYKKDILHRIEVAKDLFQKESMFNEKARQYLSLAYRQMTDGKKYEKPKELDEFVTPAEAQEKAQKYGQKLVEDACSQIDAGRPGEAARLILELVLMIVTPISG
jgi:hypothetical protein